MEFLEYLPIVEQFLDEEEDDSDVEEIVEWLAGFLLQRRDEVPKIRRFYERTILSFRLDDFRYHCRLDRATFDLLLAEIGPYITVIPPQGAGRTAVGAEKQLFVFIFYIANMMSMRNVALEFGLSKSTVHDIVHDIAQVLTTQSNKFIKWPNEERREEISRSFLDGDERNLPDVVGVIDGTHIRILNPAGADRSYVNRKGYHSVVLQVVTDDLLMINDAYVGFPGSAHDARVFRNSEFFNMCETGAGFTGDQHIIGDSAYPVKQYLLPPFRDNGRLTPAQTNYNYRLSSKRQTVERAIGHMKGRFRKLNDIQFTDQSEDRVKLMTNICNFIMAACVLHNLCVLTDDDLEQFIDLRYLEDEPAQGQPPHLQIDRQIGDRKRDRIVALINRNINR